MSKPTVQQIAGLDILDWLYFNQTLVYTVMDDDSVGYFVEIVNHVKTAVAATGASGMKAEIMKHYVCCFLEILASDDPPESKLAELSRHNKNFFCAMLIATNNFAKKESLSDALAIADVLKDYVSSVPSVVRFRMAERCLAIEYATAAHECFMWLVKAGAIQCAKFRADHVLQKLFHEAVVARIGLLCDFEWIRFHFRKVQKESLLARYDFNKIASTLPMPEKQMVMEAGDLWMAKHFGDLSRALPFAFDVARQSEKDYVAAFLRLLHLHWTRQRFCTGTSAGWVSNLGASIIMISKSSDDPRPIYIEQNGKNKNRTDNTLAKIASDHMLKYGMTIHARSLYVRHREFTAVMLPRIAHYWNVLQTMSWVLPAEEDDPYYRGLLALSWDTADVDPPEA